MVTGHVLQRVFHVRFGGSTGTAFVIDVDGRQYLVSARHVFPEVEGDFEIELLQNNQWKLLPARLIGAASGDADIVVLATVGPLSSSANLPVRVGNVAIGQDVYFLGYPFGLNTEVGALHAHLPMPLIKKACLSGRAGTSDQGVWLLDGINNPGFSGGPVVAYAPGSTHPKDLALIGIISGYRFNSEPIYDGDQPLSITSRANTGIIIAYDASIALDIIKKNPTGFDLATGAEQVAEPDA